MHINGDPPLLCIRKSSVFGGPGRGLWFVVIKLPIWIEKLYTNSLLHRYHV